ncbi:hypothetical protein PMAYCL1PPCAC_15902 [Pristionchus mayeri]|uniref:Dehydrogenase n=1 Tax=Pristionchus mayeri TaxID=1317129 RepID=A0AAN5CJR1_9BILA|nr:hypothetical protein PMAYCL1PPCAC_15902 [Pristionchus mayeri]
MNSPDLGFLWLLAIPLLPYLVYLLQDVTFLSGLGYIVLLFISYHAIQQALGIFEIGDLDKRAVFITGCDTGFGNLLALKCMKRGMPVFAGCLTEKGAAALRDASASLPGKLETLIVNVASDESVAAAAKYLDKATKPYGGLHGVVNNAGIVGGAFFDDMLTIDNYREVVEVNTFGVIRVTKAVKHLVKKTRGRIVTVASICARIGIRGIGPYTVSKYAATAYCEVIRQELHHFGVSVHILEPGFFNTPLIDEKIVQAGIDKVWTNTPDAIKREYGERFFTQGREKATSSLAMFGSPKVHLVVDAYFHALTARFPHLRYQVGVDSKLLFVPMAYLPTGLRDALAHAIAKMLGEPVPECVKQQEAKIMSAKNQ